MLSSKRSNYRRYQMDDKLAIYGGKPVIGFNLEKYIWVDKGVMPRIESLILSNSFSGFLAQPTPEHFGGPSVRLFEAEWAKLSDVEHAVTFNSWTSGLMAAVAALDLEIGSEVIVTPWTMSASVACIVANNLVPVFADIEVDSFNIDPDDVARKITSKTSGILAVDIFGKPCDAPALAKLASESGLKFLVDSAQAPRAQIAGKRTAAFADIAGYSLNRHKHIQVGEGGIAVTNNQEYAERMQLMRNHAEVSSGSKPNNSIQVGHNWRMGEIEAELARYQIESFDSHIDHRVNSSLKLLKMLSQVPGLILPRSDNNLDHDFYIIGMRLHDDLKGKRDLIAEALKAEGLQILLVGYQVLHRLPSFKRYRQDDLLQVNELHDSSFLGLYMCGHYFSDTDLEKIAETFSKVMEYYI